MKRAVYLKGVVWKGHLDGIADLSAVQRYMVSAVLLCILVDQARLYEEKEGPFMRDLLPNLNKSLPGLFSCKFCTIGTLTMLHEVLYFEGPMHHFFEHSASSSDDSGLARTQACGGARNRSQFLQYETGAVMEQSECANITRISQATHKIAELGTIGVPDERKM
ncbi:hypothetical protein C8R42DRAFT_648029 [Lentinula raphanica]|nr:hypothetical protein C8R42DRAFT_648029 [Lentinula raphanica]